ncbi:MAG: hypothetical protein AAF399_05615 [Bacteroidota bacterium]
MARLWLIMVCCLCSSALQGQELSFKQAQAIFGQQRILSFRPYSLSLTDQSQTELQEMMQLIRQYPGTIATHLLVIQVFSCEQELAVKPYLGVCRAQVVIDLLEKELGLSRKKCLIRDGGINAFDPECLAGSGVNLYLRPNWSEP